MDQLPHNINTEQSNRFEEILQQMDPSLQGYKKFLYEVIIKGISYDDFTFDALNCSLFGAHLERSGLPEFLPQK